MSYNVEEFRWVLSSQENCIIIWRRSIRSFWFALALRLVLKAGPNAAHYVIARLALPRIRQSIAPDSKFTHITQNVQPASKIGGRVKAHGGKVALFNVELGNQADKADVVFLGPCEERLVEVFGV
ncbi:hypothetical protein IW261DRAFT_1592019 [Armillaria novae-zelandiae]|uniref:Uncharacterized protein n=1 Tax=Armillaria novae-zelandiae TaxID=153914 RepID=A0AA39PGZ2_9AGAR|nr:hypothetical protein IW261DRAFT_1592019 [Armillaria novae-zelandiae]